MLLIMYTIYISHGDMYMYNIKRHSKYGELSALFYYGLEILNTYECEL